MKKKIYFAHPTEKVGTEEEKLIIQLLEKFYGYEVVNPFKEAEEELIKKYGHEYYENPSRDYALDIVEKDYWLIRNCDDIFCWLPNNTTSIGTTCEMVDCSHYIFKSVIVLSEKLNPFLIKYADKIYTSILNFCNDDPEYEKKNIKVRGIYCDTCGTVTSYTGNPKNIGCACGEVFFKFVD